MAFALRVAAQEHLHDRRHGHHGQRDGLVRGNLGMQNAVGGFLQRRDAGPQDDDGDDDRGHVLAAAMAERMLAVRLLPGKLRADDRDDGRKRIGQVVHGVQHDGDGVRQHAHKRLECRQ